jgi:general stress protein YciG
MIAPDKRLDRNPGNPSAERKGSARPSAGERPGEGASQDHPRSPPEETSKMPTLETGKPRARRGFAAMNPERRREIARKGGASVPSEKRSFAKDRDLAAQAGRKGGEASRGGGRTRGRES